MNWDSLDWDALSRLRQDLAHPNPSAPFRGSLLDEKMFAIDVHEWGMENLLQENRDRREPKIAAAPVVDILENIETNETETEA